MSDQTQEQEGTAGREGGQQPVNPPVAPGQQQPQTQDPLREHVQQNSETQDEAARVEERMPGGGDPHRDTAHGGPALSDLGREGGEVERGDGRLDTAQKNVQTT